MNSNCSYQTEEKLVMEINDIHTSLSHEYVSLSKLVSHPVTLGSCTV